MKLELDLSTSQGSRSLVQQELGDLFSIKFAELNQDLAVQFSPEQIQQMITERIRHLQKRDKIDRETEKRVREKNHEQLYTYTLKKRIFLPNKSHRDRILEYLPEMGYVIYTQQGNPRRLIRYDLKTQKRKFLMKDAPINVLLTPDRKSLIVSSFHGEVSSIDIRTGKQTILPAAPTSPSVALSLSLDPSGKVLFVGENTYNTHNESLTVIDLTTREVKKFPLPSNVGIVAVSKTKVILTSYTQPHSILDITTGIRQQIGPEKKSPQVFITDDGKEEVAIHTDSGLEFFNIESPEQPMRILPTRPSQDNASYYHKVPGADLIFIEGIETGILGLYSYNDLTDPLFQFPGYDFHDNAFFRAHTFRFSPDRKTVAVHGDTIDDTTNKVKSFIDIWEKK